MHPPELHTDVDFGNVVCDSAGQDVSVDYARLSILFIFKVRQTQCHHILNSKIIRLTAKKGMHFSINFWSTEGYVFPISYYVDG